MTDLPNDFNDQDANLTDAPDESADFESTVDKILTDVETLGDTQDQIGSKTDIEIERDDLRDSLLRLKADFENFKKRVAKQEIELIQRANMSLLEKLLPALDIYDLAMQHFEDSDPQANFDGLKKAFDVLLEVLDQTGLEKVDKVGESFNPEIHEAVSHVQSDSSDEAGVERIKEVYRAGYALKGKVIRPATVIVES
jgi:molecular chaperone GrpE